MTATRFSFWHNTAAAGAFAFLFACGPGEPHYFPHNGALATSARGGTITGTITAAFRGPDQDEAAALTRESQMRGVPVPWLSVTNVPVSLDYALTNTSDKVATVLLEIDGASEFAEYDSAALRAAQRMAAMMAGQNQEDEVTVLPLIQWRPIELAPGQTVTGVVREDDFLEAARDLDAMGRFSAPPLSVLLNRSEVNPIGYERVPAQVVTPTLMRALVHMTANTAVRAEFVLRVRDAKNQVRRDQTGQPFSAQPRRVAIMPPAMARP